MAQTDPWGSTVEGVGNASTLRPRHNAAGPRTPFTPIVENLAPTPDNPLFHGDGRYGGTPNPTAPTAGAAAPAAPSQPGMGRRIADGLVDAGKSVRGAGSTASEALVDAGKATRAVAAPVVKGALRTAALAAAPVVEVAPHYKFYTDSNVPLSDKLRVGATDAVTAIGGVVAGGAGALVGSGVAPGVGTAAGLVGGGILGAKGGHALGDALLGSDAVLRRHGYDPSRSVVDMTDGKGGGATLAPPALPGQEQRFPPTAPPAPGQVPLPAGMNPSNAGAGRGNINPEPYVAPPNPNGTILRQGNTYSGKDIKFGADIAGSPGKGTVTSLDTSEGFRQDQMELARLRAEREAQPMGGMSGIGGGTLSSSLRDKHFSTPSASILTPGQGNLKPRDIRHAQSIAAQRDIAAMQEHGATLRAGNQNSQALAIAEMNNATARRSNDQNNSTSLRGQDITYAGHMAPLQLAAQQRALHARAYADVGAGTGGAITPEQHLAAARQLHAQGLPELAAKAEAAASAAQTLTGTQDTQSAARAAGTEKLFKPYFTTVDKDGKAVFDEVGAAKAAATVRGLHGEKFDKLSDDQKRQAMVEIVAQQRNAEAERRPSMGFLDHAADLVGMYERPPENQGQVNLRGAKFERAGLISPPGVSRHALRATTVDGRTYTYGADGNISDAQVQQLQQRAQLRPN